MREWDQGLADKQLREGSDGFNDSMKLSILYNMIMPDKATTLYESGQCKTVDSVSKNTSKIWFGT